MRKRMPSGFESNPFLLGTASKCRMGFPAQPCFLVFFWQSFPLRALSKHIGRWPADDD